MTTTCDQLPTKRMRDICNGTANIPLNGRNSINAYRQSWGLPPLSVNEIKPESDQWNPSMPSRGLGDVIAKLTHATGIDRVVEAVAGKDCGCKKRQKMLNDAVPFQ